MKIILFAHPSFLVSQSMPRFAAMLVHGMKDRGHTVEIWSPEARFFRIPFPGKLKKWLGYVDQYIVFPRQVKTWLRRCGEDTLFVFADQALGPWIPMVAHRPHVIHCHDFLAQRSARGDFSENPVAFTGVQYQKYIRSGYLAGKNFISVSHKTRNDLHDFYPTGYRLSEVVYNGLSGHFTRCDETSSRAEFSFRTGSDLSSGYLLHVGGNQWYKNRIGVLDIYDAWRSQSGEVLPLVMIGAVVSNGLIQRYQQSPYKEDIYLLSGVDDEVIKHAYGGARVFLFPSLAEGFGWPIAEAMASGVPVVTTGEAPMSEVAGDAAFFIDRMPRAGREIMEWAARCADQVQRVLDLTTEQREMVVLKGIENVKRFDSKDTLDRIEQIYMQVLKDRS